MKKRFHFLLLFFITLSGCGTKTDSSIKQGSSNTSNSSTNEVSNSTSTSTDSSISIPSGELPIVTMTGDVSSYIDVGLAHPAPANPNFFLHFYKSSENYKGWFAWVWSSKPKGIGGRFNFQQVDIIDGKKWATVKFDTSLTIDNVSTNWDNANIKTKFAFSAGVKQVGMLIRDNNGKKEMEKDRIIDMVEKDIDGNVHAYIIENDSKVTQLFSAFQDNFLQIATLETNYTTVTVKSYKAFDNGSQFYLKSDESNIEIASKVLSNQNTIATLTLSSKFDINNLGKNCLVTVAGYGSAALDYSNIYDTSEFISNYTTTEELGVIYTQASSVFKLWAPTASRVVLNIYNGGSSDYDATDNYDLVRGAKGVWTYTRNSDMHGRYYNYDLTFGTLKRKEVMDPYAKSAGENGERGYIFDPAKVTPSEWNNVKMPNNTANNDAVVYEMHVRDFTNDESWNGSEANRGKFLGMIESGTYYYYNGQKYKTGYDYLTDPEDKLGVNYLQLQPIYDFSSVDESKLKDTEYLNTKYSGPLNWGYDPQNYSLPEGSYSSNPRNGLTRVSELKQVSKAYNNKGIGLIMDVVFNHMPSQSTTSYDQIVPNYYFRGRNDSGAGADMASERTMYRKYMVDMCVTWVKEYKLAGFRFDLMGLIDTETMNQISDAVKVAVKEINPNANPIIYGEGWEMYGGKDIGTMATKGNVNSMKNVGAFNDGLAYAIRGDGNDESTDKGWVAGNTYKAQSVANNIATNFSNTYPGNATNYATTHDNLTIYDKLSFTTNAPQESIKKMSLLANSIVLTTQGTAFFEIGAEFLRTKEVTASEATLSDKIITNGFKYFNRDSYNGADWFSNIKWNNMARNSDLVDAYRNMIKMRLDQNIFHTKTIGGVIVEANPINNGSAVEVKLRNTTAETGKWNNVTIVYNTSTTGLSYTFPSNQKIGFNNYKYLPDGTASGTVTIPGKSMVISYSK